MLNTTNTGVYRPSGAGVADPPQTTLVPVEPIIQGLDGIRDNQQDCMEFAGDIELNHRSHSSAGFQSVGF